MAVDSRLQTFSEDFFTHVWKCIGSKDTFIHLPKNGGTVCDITDEFVTLVLSRCFIFRKTLIDGLVRDYEYYSRNSVDCYFYLRDSMWRYVISTRMNIFDKISMSCAVLATMGWICLIQGKINFQFTGPLSWAMYFEIEFKEEFDAEGSWEKLKEYAEQCDCNLLNPPRVLEIALSKSDDLLTAIELYGSIKNSYIFEDIFKTFELRYCGNHRYDTCPKCHPLRSVFFSLRQGDKFQSVDPIILIEGYMQIFLRMEPSFDAKRLHDRIFLKKHSRSSEEKPKPNECGFCGDDVSTSVEFPPEDDSVILLYWDDICITARSKQTDLETAEELYKISENWYCFGDIVETFKQRMNSKRNRFSCSECLPLLDFFCYLSEGKHPKADDYALIEGYMQIFMRMLSLMESHELYNSLLDENFSEMPDEKYQLVSDKNKVAHTKRLQDRIFVSKYRDESELTKRDSSKYCVFCDKDVEGTSQSILRENDTKRVENLKSLIQKTISDAKFTETLESTLKEGGTSAGTATDEAQTMVLRLFLALGTEPVLSKVKANLQKEFFNQKCEQDVTNNLEHLKLQDKKDNSRQKKKKKKKKKNVNQPQI